MERLGSNAEGPEHFGRGAREEAVISIAGGIATALPAKNDKAKTFQQQALDNGMTSSHQGAPLLAARNRSNNNVMVEDLGVNVSGVDVLQTSAEARSDLPHTCEKQVPINHIVSIPLIVGKANTVRIKVAMVPPLAVQVRHHFRPS